MKPVTEADYRQRIDRVIEALSADPARPRTLDELARIAYFSRFHFHRIYRAMMGESVIETARRLRLTRAAHLLATTRFTGHRHCHGRRLRERANVLACLQRLHRRVTAIVSVAASASG